MGGQVDIVDTRTIVVERVDGTLGEITWSEVVEGTSVTKASVSIEEREVKGEGGKGIGDVGNKVDNQMSKEWDDEGEDEEDDIETGSGIG